MQTFTILADSSENPHQKPWWKFWEKLPEEDIVENEVFRIKIKYVKAVDDSCFLTDKLYQKEEENAPLSRVLSLQIFPQIAKSKGFGDSRTTSIVFCDKEINEAYLIELAKLCQSITIISDNLGNTLADKILQETGLIIESKNTLQEAEADFLINNIGEISDFSDKKQYAFDIEYNLLPTLPVKVNPLRLTKWLISQNIIQINECNLGFQKI